MKYKCSCGSEVVVSEKKYRLFLDLYCSQCQMNTNWSAIEWPDVEIDKEIWFNGDTYWKHSGLEQCYGCQNQTNWISISFQCRLCSPVCAERLWQDYFGAN